MAKEWYLLEYERKTFLHNRVLFIKTFPGGKGMHEHCELCWARFSTHPSDFQKGYYEPLSGSWICVDCYNEMASLFGWKVDEDIS